MITRQQTSQDADGTLFAVFDDNGKQIGTDYTMPLTPEQQAAQTLQQKAANALQANANFLGLTAPTNVQTVQQVQLLTRECNALIRLLIGALDTTAGT